MQIGIQSIRSPSQRVGLNNLPVPNLNGGTVEVKELIRCFITRFPGYVITYSCCVL